MTLYDLQGTKLVNADTIAMGHTLRLGAGTHRLTLRIPELHLNPGVYRMGFWIAGPLGTIYDLIPDGCEIEIVASHATGLRTDRHGRRPGDLPSRGARHRLTLGHCPARERTSAFHRARKRLRRSASEDGADPASAAA